MSEKISLRNRFIQTILRIDKAMTWYFDSHIHLSDPAYLSDMEFILKGMQSIKLKACCVSMDVENSIQTLKLAKQNELVLPFIGIHPECADAKVEKIVEMIEENHTNISGVGEIGLDPTYAGRKTVKGEDVKLASKSFNKF